jgi:hypothetical protein
VELRSIEMQRILTFSVLITCLIVPAWCPGFAFGSGQAASPSARFSLVVEAEESGQRFFCLPVSPDEVFQIEFLHSYDRFPFKEFYRIEKDGKIRLFKMVFRSLLNGQGFVYPGAHIRPDGWGEINDIASVEDRVEFIMGARKYANHRLTLRGIEYTLSDVIPQGTIVAIRVLETPCGDHRATGSGDFGHAR